METSKPRKRLVTKQTPEPHLIELPVPLLLHPALCHQITWEFLKYLLFDRQQIRCPYQILEDEVSTKTSRAIQVDSLKFLFPDKGTWQS
jgi:hypothetical protein